MPELGVQDNGMTPAEEALHEGHLMGKKKNGKRAIDPHEIAEIAAATGMTCDEATCCPEERKRRPEARRGRRARDLHAEEGGDLLTPCAPTAFGAHAGAAIDDDVAERIVGPTLLRQILRGGPRAKRR